MAEHRPNDSKKVAEEILGMADGMREKRRAFDSVWESVCDYCAPELKGFTGKVEHPHEPDEQVVDSTARRAANTFAAGMQSGVASPSQRWFALAFEDDGLDDHAPGRAWLQRVEDDFYRDLHCNGYYPQQHVSFHQGGLFGWQCLFMDAGMFQPTRYQAMHLYEMSIRDNARGEADTASRRFSLSARQCAQEWGKENLPESIRKKLDGDKARKQDAECEIVHLVLPRSDGDWIPGEPGAALPFASYFVSVSDKQVISEGGYREQPYIVTRSHRLPGTPYSYSPGTEALADVKMMNEMKRLILEAGQLSTAPPFLAPDDGFVGRLSYGPRAINFYRNDRDYSPSDFAPLGVGGDPNFSWELLMSVKQDINEAFFVDLFQAVIQRSKGTGNATAHEIAEIANERMFMLGPMLAQQQRENFQKLFARLFSIKQSMGLLPPAPPDLAGREVRVEYTSPLFLAQKEAQTQAVLRTYGDARVVAEMAPEVLDLFNHDSLLRRIMEQRGFPQTGVNSREQVQEIRTQRAQAQQEAAQAEALAQAAQAYPALSRRAEEGSPMRRMAGEEGA